MEAVETKEKDILIGPVMKAKPQWQKNKELIEELAESIHPGNWDLDTCEDRLYSFLEDGYIDSSEYACNECGSCDDGYYSECESKEDYIMHRLLIHFPEVEITNSMGHTHTMTDIYIATVFTADYSQVATKCLFLIRGSATTKELAVGYAHSHASSANSNNSVSRYFCWRELCLGGDTELTDIMYNLSDGISNKDLHELLVLLHLYVGWESREGGPYMYMNDIQYKSSNISSSNYLPDDLSITIGRILLLEFAKHSTLSKPDIVGTGAGIAISNVTASIAIALKKFILDSMAEDLSHPYISMLGTQLSRAGEDDSFTPLVGIVPHSDYNLEFYIHCITEAEDYSFPQILKFNGENIQLSLTLDPKGLDSSATFTTADIISAVVNPLVIQRAVEAYLEDFKLYRTQYKLQLL